MKKIIVMILSVALVTLAVSAGEMSAADTTGQVEVLHEVEVVGLKHLPGSALDATTVVTPTMISRYGIAAMKDVAVMAPNFYIPDYGTRMTSTVYVRGLGARIDQPVVGLNIDGVGLLNKDGYDFDMADVRRIEMIRGAQSVLNGRNTMGGQINVTTYSPLNFRGVRAMLEFGRFSSLKASAGYYAGLTDHLGMSLAAYVSRTDGSRRNLWNNSRVDAGEQGSLRWHTAWQPSTALTITNTAAASLSRQHGYPYAPEATGVIAYNDTCFYRRATITDGLTVSWTGDGVRVTSQTSLQYLDDNMTLDQDFTPKDYFTLNQKRTDLAVTEDVFAIGRKGNYGWLAGLYGFWHSYDMTAPVTFGDTGISELLEYHPNKYNPDYPIEWDDRSFELGSDFTASNAGIAVYHQSDIRLGRWTIEAGLRLDIEHAALDYRSHADASYTIWHMLPDGNREFYRQIPLKVDEKGHLSRTFCQLLPKITVSYRTGDVTAYASVGKGYKAGGYNTQMFSDVLQQRIMSMMGMGMAYNPDEVVSYRPEMSINYEIGARAASDDGRYRGEVTAFFIDCRDQQLTMFPPGTITGRVMTNAGRTFSRGFELSATAHFTDALVGRASYGFTHATFHRFNDGRTDYRGRRLPYAPAHTLFAGVDWLLPVDAAGCQFSLGADLRGVGDIWWDEANTSHQPFYALLGASFTAAKGPWSLRLWGENLTSTHYATFRFVSMSRSFVQLGRPLTFGITLRYVLSAAR